MGWVGLGTYFRQPDLPNNPLGQGNPSSQPYRTGTLLTLNTSCQPFPLKELALFKYVIVTCIICTITIKCLTTPKSALRLKAKQWLRTLIIVAVAYRVWLLCQRRKLLSS